MGCAVSMFYKQGSDPALTSPYSSLLDVPAVDIDGKHIERLGDVLSGKKCMLISNVSSKWAFTDEHYTQFVELHTELSAKGFEILAFPSNQFFTQEPGTNKEIKSLVRNFYEAEFLLFEKSDVNGPATNEVFKFLRANTPEFNSKGSDQLKQIPWNFSKFLVNKEGKVVAFYDTKISPSKLKSKILQILESESWSIFWLPKFLEA